MVVVVVVVRKAPPVVNACLMKMLARVYRVLVRPATNKTRKTHWTAPNAGDDDFRRTATLRWLIHQSWRVFEKGKLEDIPVWPFLRIQLDEHL